MCGDSRRPGAERVPIEENQPTPDFAATEENKNKLRLGVNPVTEVFTISEASETTALFGTI